MHFLVISSRDEVGQVHRPTGLITILGGPKTGLGALKKLTNLLPQLEIETWT